jgi:hypothetical protein
MAENKAQEHGSVTCLQQCGWAAQVGCTGSRNWPNGGHWYKNWHAHSSSNFAGKFAQVLAHSLVE